MPRERRSKYANDAKDTVGIASQVESLSSSLAQSETEIRTTQSNPTNFNGAIVTIIDDDARPNFRTVWQPILDVNPDVKIGIAVVKDWTLDGSSLSLSELLVLQNQGHDLLCHTAHHEPSYEITPQRAELDYPVARQWMKVNGLKGYEHLVYPGGLNPSFVTIKDVARKYFKYAISTQTAGDYATTPVDNWCIPRIDGDGKTLDQLKVAVDYAKTNGIWLVVMTHSHVLLSAGSQKMSDFIAYVKSQNVPIMSYTEAVKHKGNAVALGEYTDSNSMFVSVKGKSKSNALTIESGTWTPTLVGSTTAGTNTYTTQVGSYSKFGNIVIARFDIRIESTGLDAALAGNLRINGLPFAPLASESTAVSAVDYNILNLGTNFTGVIVRTNGTATHLPIYKTGNNVSSAFVAKTDIPASQPIIFRGQVMYRTT
jgi:peptidoglycan/xylan/chitin deacetylase (PgdA/CDA1 family)